MLLWTLGWVYLFRLVFVSFRCTCRNGIAGSYGSSQRRQRQSTPALLPGKSHEQRSLVGYSPRSCEESDTTEQLHFHFSLSCIGEGNGSPLQCSCLENPRDGGAWWAAVFGVAQSWTRLKRLGSGSGMEVLFLVFWENSILFSTVTRPIYIPINGAGGFHEECTFILT